LGRGSAGVRVWARFKFSRHGARHLRIFGRTATERKLVADYEALLGEIMLSSTPRTTTFASVRRHPGKIRGFGHVRHAIWLPPRPTRRRWLDQFRTGGTPILKAPSTRNQATSALGACARTTPGRFGARHRTRHRKPCAASIRSPQGFQLRFVSTPRRRSCVELIGKSDQRHRERAPRRIESYARHVE